MIAHCPSQEQVLMELESLAPGVPLLALGQTVFWDEPMKAGVALGLQRLGLQRKLVAGVHDTDYFAKLPGDKDGTPSMRALPHNDSSTKGLWSAAGEFSTLFGSETVVTRETLQRAGLKLGKIARARPGVLDDATEAWGWRGLVMIGGETKVTAELPLREVFGPLFDTLDWALSTSLDMIEGLCRRDADTQAERLRALVCDASEPVAEQTLGGYFRELIPDLYRFVSGSDVEVEATATTELLRFNTRTAGLPRFDILRAFVEPATRRAAAQSYNDVVRNTEVYELDRFGTGAIPFDLVVPGHGRGTVRIGTKGVVIMTPTPQFLTLRKPLESLEQLAESIEAKFGPNCTFVGKAITLIGMLSREFVFVFHEGASAYVKHSVRLHRELIHLGVNLDLHPILRIRYEPWDAMSTCCAWVKLPEPLRSPFGVDELCVASFASRWKQVAEEQTGLLTKLGALVRPLDLIRFLDQTVGGNWRALALEYESIHQGLEQLNVQIGEVKARKAAVNAAIKQTRRERVELEIAKGQHWRERIFERQATVEDMEERSRYAAKIQAAIERRADLTATWRQLQAEQDEMVSRDEVKRAHSRRRDIELEAELKRLKLIRSAVIASKGLQHAGHRPGAWWFPLICPGGSWFRETIARANYRVEPLT